MINADRGDLDVQFFDSQLLDQFMLNRLPCFGTEPAHALLGVIAGQRGKVHAGDRAQQPCRLPFLLHRAAGNVTLRPALDRTGVDANLLHPVEIKRNATVGQKGTAGQGGDGRFQFGRELCPQAHASPRCATP